MIRYRTVRRWVLAAVLPAMVAVSGCRKPEMSQQAKYKPMQSSDFFANGTSARLPVAGTVPRDYPPVYNGLGADGRPVDTFPFPITKLDLKRGQELFNIYCAVCHSRLGDGDGMIPRRGFVHPPSFLGPPLNDPAQDRGKVGHYVDVITNGYGEMFSYSDRVASDDRWRIAAYIRALQLSRKTPTNMLSEEDKRMLGMTTQKQTPTTGPAASKSPDNRSNGTRS